MTRILAAAACVLVLAGPASAADRPRDAAMPKVVGSVMFLGCASGKTLMQANWALGRAELPPDVPVERGALPCRLIQPSEGLRLAGTFTWPGTGTAIGQVIARDGAALYVLKRDLTECDLLAAIPSDVPLPAGCR